MYIYGLPLVLCYAWDHGRPTEAGREGGLMAIQVKDAAAAAKKFVTRAQTAGPDYTSGVSNAGQKWATQTKSSADSYTAGTQAAIAEGRFAASIDPAAAQKFQTRAAGIGSQRYTQGVAQAGDAWQTATKPYLDVIANLNLPARRMKGDPSNWQRAIAVGDALRAKKLGK